MFSLHEKSSKAASTAARFVFTPAKLIASLRNRLEYPELFSYGKNYTILYTDQHNFDFLVPPLAKAATPLLKFHECQKLIPDPFDRPL